MNIIFFDYWIYYCMNVFLFEVDVLVDCYLSIMCWDVMEVVVDGYFMEMSVVMVLLGGWDGKFDDKLCVLLNFGEYVCEFVLFELVLRFLSMLGGEYNIMLGDWVGLVCIFFFIVMKIIFMENVNGCLKVEVGDFCEWKNGRGVDINWNWEVDWGKKEKDYDFNEEYLGIVFFSEFEMWIL